jgi:hypothetical protein
VGVPICTVRATGQALDRGAGSGHLIAMGNPATGPMFPQIKSPLLHSIHLFELMSNNASMCRELPFVLSPGIRRALRIPDAAGAYRGIRANMEQTSMRTGLDHRAEGA